MLYAWRFLISGCWKLSLLSTSQAHDSVTIPRIPTFLSSLESEHISESLRRVKLWPGFPQKPMEYTLAQFQVTSCFLDTEKNLCKYVFDASLLFFFGEQWSVLQPIGSLRCVD